MLDHDLQRDGGQRRQLVDMHVYPPPTPKGFVFQANNEPVVKKKMYTYILCTRRECEHADLATLSSRLGRRFFDPHF